MAAEASGLPTALHELAFGQLWKFCLTVGSPASYLAAVIGPRLRGKGGNMRIRHLQSSRLFRSRLCSAESGALAQQAAAMKY
jgi:hypothetical protein